MLVIQFVLNTAYSSLSPRLSLNLTVPQISQIRLTRIRITRENSFVKHVVLGMNRKVKGFGMPCIPLEKMLGEFCVFLA